jgi:hypothetical protein
MTYLTSALSIAKYLVSSLGLAVSVTRSAAPVRHRLVVVLRGDRSSAPDDHDLHHLGPVDRRPPPGVTGAMSINRQELSSCTHRASAAPASRSAGSFNVASTIGRQLEFQSMRPALWAGRVEGPKRSGSQ